MPSCRSNFLNTSVTMGTASALTELWWRRCTIWPDAAHVHFASPSFAAIYARYL